MTYNGCCEPLPNKIPVLKNVPNLRKVSVSPWADVRVVITMCLAKSLIMWLAVLRWLSFPS